MTKTTNDTLWPNTILVNADDFGMDRDVNRAILDGFHQGLISTTSLMANMPGFEEACQLCHDHQLLDSVGLHLNLGEGFPLTEAMRRCSRFSDPEGRFQLSSAHLTSFLNATQQKILADEIRAQVAACRRMGVVPTHLDSHRHLHVQWAILNVVLAVAREQGIRFVRIPRNCGEGIGPAAAIYKALVTRKITAAGMRRTQLFGSLADYLWLKNRGRSGASMEIMIHPRYLASGVLCNYPNEAPLAPQMRKVESYQGSLSSDSPPGGRKDAAKTANVASPRDRMNLQNKGFILTAVAAGLMFPAGAQTSETSSVAAPSELARAVAASDSSGRELK